MTYCIVATCLLDVGVLPSAFSELTGSEAGEGDRLYSRNLGKASKECFQGELYINSWIQRHSLSARWKLACPFSDCLWDPVFFHSLGSMVNAFVKGLLLGFLLGTPNHSILLTVPLGSHQVLTIPEESVSESWWLSWLIRLSVTNVYQQWRRNRSDFRLI